MASKLAVVIPFYNMWHLTHARLYELYRHIDVGIDIILVDDASTEKLEIDGGIVWWQNQVKKHSIRYYRNPENLGFGGSCNKGARVAFENVGADAVVFLSNDVMIGGNFISPILGILDATPNVLIGGQIVDWRAGWNQVIFRGHEMVIPYAAGWLLACTKDVWNRLGGFDPIFGRFDFEDVDLSTTAIALGIELKGLNISYLKHLSGVTIATLPIDRMAETVKNKQKYVEKWEGRWPEIIERLERSHA